MKLFWRLLALLLLLQLAACAHNTRVKPAKPAKFLKFWQGFKLRGTAWVAQGGGNARRFCVLQKNKQSFRIDILEGGVLGARPRPVFSAWADTTSISWRNPDENTINQLTTDDFTSQYGLDIAALFNLTQYLPKLVKPGTSYKVGQAQVVFNNNYFPKQITSDNWQLYLGWEGNRLISVTAWEDGTKKAQIDIDKALPAPVNIQKLR